MEDQLILEAQIQLELSKISIEDLNRIFKVNKQGQSNIQSCVRGILCDAKNQLISEQIFYSLKNYKSLKKDQYQLQQAKQNLLQHYQNAYESTPTVYHLANLCSYLIRYLNRPKAQPQSPKKLITVANQAISSPRGQNTQIETSCFVNKPLYFREKKLSNDAICNQIIQKNKKVKQYEELLKQRDDFERYRQWHQQQIEIKEERKSQIRQARQSSREFRLSSPVSLSPAPSASRKGLVTPREAPNDSFYEAHISRLKAEIKSLEQQLDNNHF